MTMACTSFAAEAIAHVLQKNVMIEDVTTNAHHGVYVGDFTSKADGAYMDGTLDQFGVIPDHADLRITTTSGVFSIEFWIRSSSFATEGATGQRAICKNEDASNQWAVTFTDDIANGGGRLTLGVDYAGVTYSVTGNVGNNVIPYNVLSHCVCTMNATTPLLYVNGILVTTTASAPGLGSGANFLLGRLAQNSSTGRFTGILRRVAYYPDVLTPIEILTHYAAGDIPNTNMIARSQEFDNASWTKVRSSVTANSTTAPDGSTTADTLVEDASVGTTHYCFNSNVAAANSKVFTYSVHAKTKERSQIRLYVQEGASGTDFFYAYFNVTLGTVLSTGSGGTGVLWSATITASAQGFYRCAVTGIYGTTGTTLDAIIFLASNGSSTFSGDGVSGIYLWGAQLEQQDAVHRYIPTAAAAVTISSYNATILADAPKALWPMEEGSADRLDSWPQKPIAIDVNNECWRGYSRVDTLSIEDTLGEQMSCLFQIVNPNVLPVVGNQVRVRYYDEVLFAGTIDRITRTTNNNFTDRQFECICCDWSQILVRNRITRNFINVSLVAIIQSLLDNELSNEGLTMGTIDLSPSVPMAEASGASAFDFVRDLAAVTGQTFYVDNQKRLQFRVTSNDSAPSITVSTAETASLKIDRETYRNVQQVRVTGTPTGGEEAQISTQELTNDDQIAERAALEGGTGRYENIEEITHPTSNSVENLELLGTSYTTLRLATSGVLRQTLRCRVRQYGFRAGQFIVITLPLLDVSGTWLIQRVTVSEEYGRKLIHELELVQSSLQQRAYESWLNIVRSGKITVQIFGAITHSSQMFTTPGVSNFVVPADITVLTITVKAGSGGGGRGAMISTFNYGAGGPGGSSGKVTGSLNVTPGETVVVTVGSKGAGSSGTDGFPGTLSSAYYLGINVMTANPGLGGGHAIDVGWYVIPGAAGTAGGGSGPIVTVGGGLTGGAGGPGFGAVEGSAGQDGNVEISW